MHKLSKPFVLAALLCFVAVAADPDGVGEVNIARVKYDGGGDWYSDPTSLPNLLRGLQSRCGIPAADRDVTVELTPSALSGHPLLYLTGHGTISFSSPQVRALREHLLAGGLLWADDNYGMNKSFREQMAKVFPELTWKNLPVDHPIFSSFYRFPEGAPKIHEHDGAPPQVLGLFWDDRLVCLYTYETDIGDGLESEGVHPQDSPEEREAALRMALNIIVYFLSS